MLLLAILAAGIIIFGIAFTTFWLALPFCPREKQGWKCKGLECYASCERRLKMEKDLLNRRRRSR